jgi:hypothetical protein
VLLCEASKRQYKLFRLSICLCSCGRSLTFVSVLDALIQWHDSLYMLKLININVTFCEIVLI